MFGLEILDVVIGLTFVYLLLSLFATALNEYIAAVLNLRGRELAHGLGQLLDDVDERSAVKCALDGLTPDTIKKTLDDGSLTERLYNHRLVRPLATRRSIVFSLRKSPRLPSYLPARTFALALLDLLGVKDNGAIPSSLAELETAGVTAQSQLNIATKALDTAQSTFGAAENDLNEAEKTLEGAVESQRPAAQTQADEAKSALEKARSDLKLKVEALQQASTASKHRVALAQLGRVLSILARESPQDVKEQIKDLDSLLGTQSMDGAVKLRLLDSLTGTQTQLQKLHDSVEVWFNNSMDRVSGAYKRKAQGWLFVLGLMIAACMNADTIGMWQRLAADDELRAAMVRRAEATIAALDTTLADSAAVPTTMPPGVTQRPPVNAATQAQRTDSASLALVAGGTAPADSAHSDSAKVAAVKQARANYLASRTRLDSMELTLGWTRTEAMRIGLIAPDSTYSGKPPVPAPWNLPFWFKLLGLFLTGIAISLGAPFWFDLLNKVISIRTAGRSPVEQPKSPEGPPKRRAEHTPK